LAKRRAELDRDGGYQYPASQTPWQEIHRALVDQLADGMVLKPAVKYQRVAQKSIPRDSH
jgi:dihydroxy-acid dehydratase